MNVLLKFVICATLVAAIRSDCDVCQEGNNVACHTSNSYTPCMDGMPTGVLIACPDDYICTGDESICYSPDVAAPSCLAEDDGVASTTSSPTVEVNQCGICDVDKVFACLDEYTYGFCFGMDTIDTKQPPLAITCPENTVCNIINKSEFCTDSSLAKPSCVPVDDTITTTSNPITTTTTIEKDTTTTQSSTGEIDTTTTEIVADTTTTESSTGEIETTEISTGEVDTTTTEIDRDTTTTESSTGEIDTTTTESSTGEIDTTTTEISPGDLDTTTTGTTTIDGDATTTDSSIAENETTSATEITMTTTEPTTTTEIDTSTTEDSTTMEFTTTTDINTSTTEITAGGEDSTTIEPITTTEHTTTTTEEDTTTRQSSIETETSTVSTTEKDTTMESTTDKDTTFETTKESPTTTTIEINTTTESIPTEKSTETSTTETVITTTTTRSPEVPRTPNEICQAKGSSGFYKPDNDATCNRFVVCYGNPIQGFERGCPTKQYFNEEIGLCTSDRPKDCPPETTTTSDVNSVPTTVPTTIPRDPNQLCADMGLPGSYNMDGDLTCTKFVMCYTMNGSLLGLVKYCPSGQFYHHEVRLCISDKPEGCL